jgi:hypothetical protein
LECLDYLSAQQTRRASYKSCLGHCCGVDSSFVDSDQRFAAMSQPNQGTISPSRFSSVARSNHIQASRQNQDHFIWIAIYWCILLHGSLERLFAMKNDSLLEMFVLQKFPYTPKHIWSGHGYSFPG